MRGLRSLLYNVYFYVTVTGILLVMLLVLPFPTGVIRVFVRAWARAQVFGLKILVGLEYEVRGRENIIDGPAIYAAKHQSAWDTFIYFLVLDQPCYVLKKELMAIPVWGICAKKAGAISVDRSGGGAALKKLLRDSRDCMSRGFSIVIFPEGTRVTPGARLPYHPGVAAVYGQTGTPVVPVAVNSGLFWGRRKFTRYSGRVILEFLPVIEPGLPRREFMERLETTVEDCTERLTAEAVEEFPDTRPSLAAIE